MRYPLIIVYSALGQVSRGVTSVLWRFLLAEFGRNSRIPLTCRIYRPRRVRIGSRSVLNDYVHIWGTGYVTIGSDVLIAAHTSITSQSHSANALAENRLYRETNVLGAVVIGDNVWIGTNATILPGVMIGEGSIVGAGAVVTRSVPSGSLVVGVPARIVRTLS